jgi:PBP1b-binding outer membrane lipoprotein LpoB
MTKIERILKYALIFLIIVILSGCAPSRKNTWVAKRKEASRVNTTKVGRNRFFFSTDYQRKLQKNYRRKRY